jgi:hypothetical protein
MTSPSRATDLSGSSFPFAQLAPFSRTSRRWCENQSLTCLLVLYYCEVHDKFLAPRNTVLITYLTGRRSLISDSTIALPGFQIPASNVYCRSSVSQTSSLPLTRLDLLELPPCLGARLRVLVRDRTAYVFVAWPMRCWRDLMRPSCCNV